MSAGKMKTGTKIERATHVIDATDQTVGRLATQIATLLRGKNKPTFERHIDAGDIVQVKNVSALKFTGRKIDQKVYHRYSGYPGGLKTVKLKDLMAKKPEEVLRIAVLHMIPKNRLRPNIIKRLRFSK